MDDWPAIEAFIRRNSFALLISEVEGKPWATHLVLELEENVAGEKKLWGHFSRANPQWKFFNEEKPAMAVFLGPHTYVSSSWYNHVNVPTWNYLAVHVYGKIRFMNETETLELLRRLVDKHEKSVGQSLSVNDMPPDFVKKEMKGLVAFEMTLDSIEGQWKLSQNRNDEDFANIITELERLNNPASREIAGEMKKIM
jgi:transcriptional regulator